MSRYPRKLVEACNLKDTAATGPAFLEELPPEFRERYDLWVNTWIIPAMDRLIPELVKENKKLTK